MALYLMRHGKYVPKEIHPDCPLSDAGLVEVMHTARLATGKKIEVNRIFHSGKKRARQTAVFMEEFFQPPYGVTDSVGLDPNDDIFYALGLIERTDNIMIIGHLPFLERLAAYLVTGNREKTVVRLPTAGMVCLDRDPKGKWKVKWQLAPE